MPSDYVATHMPEVRKSYNRWKIKDGLKRDVILGAPWMMSE